MKLFFIEQIFKCKRFTSFYGDALYSLYTLAKTANASNKIKFKKKTKAMEYSG